MKKDNTRAVIRHPYKSAVIYATLGDPVHPPDKTETLAEIVDLSDSGMRMRIRGKVLEEGHMLRIRIPMAAIEAAVPTLAEVVWTKKQDAKAYHAGLRFVV